MKNTDRLQAGEHDQRRKEQGLMNSMTTAEAIKILKDSNQKLKSDMSFMSGVEQGWRESAFKNMHGYTMQEAKDKYDACELAIEALIVKRYRELKIESLANHYSSLPKRISNRIQVRCKNA